MSLNGPIINAHEHIGSFELARPLLDVMDSLGIESTVLLGSSNFTLTLDYKVGFTGYDENNELVVRLHQWAPDRFEAWPTLWPADPGGLEKLRALHADGATGLKLYIGHGFRPPDGTSFLFHAMPINDSRLDPIYDYCSREQLPVCLHVNPSADDGRFLTEFEDALRRFPDLRVNAPHWALSSIRISRLRALLDEFPNLVTDLSFGHDTYLLAGLGRISNDVDKYRRFIQDYPDRLMFGTDLVLTGEPRKTRAWIRSRTSDYLNLLAADTFRSELAPERSFNGLSLDPAAIQQIVYENYKKFQPQRRS